MCETLVSLAVIPMDGGGWGLRGRYSMTPDDWLTP